MAAVADRVTAPARAFADGADACRTLVRENLGEDAECIKIYTTEGLVASSDQWLDTPNFTDDEITAMTGEAHRRPVLPRTLAALRNGVDTIAHGPPTNRTTRW